MLPLRIGRGSHASGFLSCTLHMHFGRIMPIAQLERQFLCALCTRPTNLTNSYAKHSSRAIFSLPEAIFNAGRVVSFLSLRDKARRQNSEYHSLKARDATDTPAKFLPRSSR